MDRWFPDIWFSARFIAFVAIAYQRARLENVNYIHTRDGGTPPWIRH